MNIYTKRCTAEERKAIIRMSAVYGHHPRGFVDPSGVEPALGTLEQRLDIIIRRLGGRIHAPRSGEDLSLYREAS